MFLITGVGTPDSESNLSIHSLCHAVEASSWQIVNFAYFNSLSFI
jgi:hypothetical protein